MSKSLTVRCVLSFAALEAVFAPTVIVAFIQLFGIGDAQIAYGAAIAMTLVKIAAWVWMLLSVLEPYEDWNRLPPEARTPSDLAAADAALQGAPLRFGFWYSVGWSLSFVAAVAWLWSLGPDRVPLGTGTAEVMALVGVAIQTGSFAFAYPLTALLTSEGSKVCSAAAQERRMVLLRRPAPLQLRIGLVALCLGLAPTLWVMGLGYMRQLESARERNVLVTRLAASEALRLSSLPDAPPVAEVEKAVVGIAGPNARLLALDTIAKASQVEEGASPAAAALGAVPELRAWLLAARERHQSGARLAMRAPATAAFARAPDGRGVAVLLSAPAEPSSSFVVSASLFALVVGLWAPICAFVLGRAVSSPVNRLASVARAIVEEGRLSEMQAIPIERNDEIGDLTQQFNKVVILMRSLSEAARAIATGDLRAEISGRGELPDAFRTMIESLRRIVLQLRDTSVDLASAAAEILTASQEQEVAAATQSSAMAEISRTVDSLSESAAHVSEAVQNVLSNAERTLENTDEAVRRIGELTMLANRIAEILEVIREIADRSDLLALNGSLEASRAGEGGGGFAFVASEMRRLAERVTASVQDVKKLVTDIRDSSSSTVVATEESRKLAEGTTQAARQITFVTQQQRSSTEQVSLSVKNVADVVSQAASATSQTRASAGGLKQHADKLADVVKQFEDTTAEAG